MGALGGLSGLSALSAILSSKDLVLDTFTDVNTTALANHTPNTDFVGAGWTDVVAGITIESNKANDNQGDRKAVVDTGKSDVIITCDLGINGGNFHALIFRWQDSTHFFVVGADIVNNVTALWINNAGFTQLANPAHTYTNGDAVSFKIILLGNSIKVEIDGIEEINETNSTFQSETEHGLYQDGTVWGADGTWDNFKVTE